MLNELMTAFIWISRGVCYCFFDKVYFKFVFIYKKFYLSNILEEAAWTGSSYSIYQLNCLVKEHTLLKEIVTWRKIREVANFISFKSGT